MKFGKTVSSEQSLQNSISKLNAEVVGLENEKNTTLNVFRATAENLKDINGRLEERKNTAETMIRQLTNASQSIDRQMGDNSKVIEKIEDFLG